MHAGSQARTTIQGELSCLFPEATACYCGSGYFLEHNRNTKVDNFWVWGQKVICKAV
jgi:hypothetical protein